MTLFSIVTSFRSRESPDKEGPSYGLWLNLFKFSNLPTGLFFPLPANWLAKPSASSSLFSRHSPLNGVPHTLVPPLASLLFFRRLFETIRLPSQKCDSRACTRSVHKLVSFFYWRNQKGSSKMTYLLLFPVLPPPRHAKAFPFFLGNGSSASS